MEPWQQEALFQLWREKRALPRCVCCGGTIETEEYLDLSAFGLKGASCSRCVEANMLCTQPPVEDTRRGGF